ncbi:TPA: hypothetical protein QCS32_006063 [Bacillus thuringiensis]|uniref:Crystaline entomocidal protoxin n=1 Tax=Bacillus thuringiensis serovar iberica TaxID=180866 RepID=A0A9X6QPI8_BACTU|nr:hypothetical protein [Bacillus thuringiensis]MEB9626316.1 hypothetical protein [Bacillus cereus]OUB48746.1 hypothetical protein BK741_13385 [Bacillus thuringiensis serovar iberica]HDR5354254.1 hypothetical protein [Bacillus thuringiensis]
MGTTGILLPIFWPTASDPNVVWKSLIANAENLVDAKIDEVMKNLAISKLNGLKSAMNKYKQAIERLKKEPTNPIEQEAVRTTYKNTDMIFLYSMPQFVVRNFEI